MYVCISTCCLSNFLVYNVPCIIVTIIAKFWHILPTYSPSPVSLHEFAKTQFHDHMRFHVTNINLHTCTTCSCHLYLKKKPVLIDDISFAQHITLSFSLLLP